MFCPLEEGAINTTCLKSFYVLYLTRRSLSYFVVFPSASIRKQRPLAKNRTRKKTIILHRKLGMFHAIFDMRGEQVMGLTMVFDTWLWKVHRFTTMNHRSSFRRT